MSSVDRRAHTDADAAGASSACDDCALSGPDGCCGGDHANGLMRSDRVVLALAGGVVALIAVALLTVDSSRHLMVWAPALATVGVGVAVGALGAASLRPGQRSDRAAAVALRLLPLGVAGLLLSAGLAVVGSLLT